MHRVILKKYFLKIYLKSCIYLLIDMKITIIERGNGDYPILSCHNKIINTQNLEF